MLAHGRMNSRPETEASRHLLLVAVPVLAHAVTLITDRFGELGE